MLLLFICAHHLRQVWNHPHPRQKRDVNHRLRHRMDDNFLRLLHRKDGIHLMTGSKEFFGSFVPAFHHGCDLPAGGSGSGLPACYCLPVTRPCFAFVASCCCSTADVGRYFPGDQNISKVWLIRLKGYSPYPVSR